MRHGHGLRKLNRTSEHRLAIEAWFFAPSHYPLDQVPLLV